MKKPIYASLKGSLDISSLGDRLKDKMNKDLLQQLLNAEYEKLKLTILTEKEKEI